MQQKNPNLWEALADRGYKGLIIHIRDITPIKERLGKRLTRDKRGFNYDHAKARIILELFFGRIEKLWNITKDT